MIENSSDGVQVVERHDRYSVLVHEGGNVYEYGPFSQQAAYALANEEEARLLARSEQPAVRNPDPIEELRKFLREADGAFGSL